MEFPVISQVILSSKIFEGRRIGGEGRGVIAEILLLKITCLSSFQKKRDLLIYIFILIGEIDGVHFFFFISEMTSSNPSKVK